MRNKIEDLLSRVTALEADFATLPGDVDEQRRRYQLVRYVIPRPLLRLDIDSLPAISTTSRGDCGPSTRGKSCSNLMTTFETMKMYSGFSKICGRLSPITGFVHNLGAVLDVDEGNRWHNEWRTTSKNAKR